MTLPEVLLWKELRAVEGPRFRRQHPIGPYVLDFYCPAAALCVEVDGRSHGAGDRPARDDARDRQLSAEGIKTLRIDAAEVLRDPRAAALWIMAQASAPPPSGR